MVNQIISENRHSTSTHDEKVDLDGPHTGFNHQVLSPGHPQINRPQSSMRHKSILRVDMTGNLVTDDDDGSDDSCLSRGEGAAPHPCSVGKIVQQAAETELDMVEVRRILSRYREQKEKVRVKDQSRDHDNTRTNEANRLIQKHRLETNKQHNNVQASTIQQKTTSLKSCVDENDVLTVDFFRRKIQTFDGIINSWCSPEFPSGQHAANTGNDTPLAKTIEVGKASNQQLDKEKTIISNIALSKSGSRLVLAPLRRKNPKRSTQQASSVMNTEEDIMSKRTTTNSSRDETEKEETKMSCDSPSGLNETMSTCSSVRDVEMGGPLSAETNTTKRTRTISKSMIFQVPSLRRFMMISGTISIIMAIYGVGMLFGYLSYMRSAK